VSDCALADTMYTTYCAKSRYVVE